MLKEIKNIIKTIKEENRKEKARKAIISKMTAEEYRAFVGAREIARKRQSFIDYGKSQREPHEYNLQRTLTTVEEVGSLSIGKRKKVHGFDYIDHGIYKVTEHKEASITEREQKLKSSKEIDYVNSILSKYAK